MEKEQLDSVNGKPDVKEDFKNKLQALDNIKVVNQLLQEGLFVGKNSVHISMALNFTQSLHDQVLKEIKEDESYPLVKGLFEK